MHKWRMGVVAVAMAAAAVAAPSVALAEETVQLVLTDYRFTPDRIVLQTGKTYRLTLVNRGSVEHEFVAGRQLMMAGGGDGEEQRYMTNFFDGVEVLVQFEGGAVEAEELAEVEVEPGGEVSLVFSVPNGKQGQWEFACFVPGHYELGMHGVLVVR